MVVHHHNDGETKLASKIGGQLNLLGVDYLAVSAKSYFLSVLMNANHETKHNKENSIGEKTT